MIGIILFLLILLVIYIFKDLPTQSELNRIWEAKNIFHLPFYYDDKGTKRDVNNYRKMGIIVNTSNFMEELVYLNSKTLEHVAWMRDVRKNQSIGMGRKTYRVNRINFSKKHEELCRLACNDQITFDTELNVPVSYRYHRGYYMVYIHKYNEVEKKYDISGELLKQMSNEEFYEYWYWKSEKEKGWY